MWARDIDCKCSDASLSNDASPDENAAAHNAQHRLFVYPENGDTEDCEYNPYA